MSENETKKVENVEVKETEVNGIKIAEEVVAKIAGIAASEVKGVFGMNGGLVEGFSEIFGKKSFSKGVKVQVTEKDATIDLNIHVQGVNLPKDVKDGKDMNTETMSPVEEDVKVGTVIEENK